MKKVWVAAGTAVLLLVVLGVLLLVLAIDGEAYGTVAEWVGAIGTLLVGLLAAVFAALAWRESQLATHMARLAVRTQDRANLLAERSMRVDLKPSLHRSDHNGETWVRLELSGDSVPIFLWDVAFHFGQFFERDIPHELIGEDQGRLHRTFGFDPPVPLLPGHSTDGGDPYSQIHKGKEVSIEESAIGMTIVYSFTPGEDAPRHDLGLREVDLSVLAGPPRIY